MPIANPPSKPIHHTAWMRDNIGIWRDWYAEIESGRRTFRFIGEDTEYDLRGAVRRGGFDERNRTQKRRAGTHDEEPAQAGATEGKSGVLPFVLVSLFLAGGLAFYLVKRKPRHA